MSNHTENLARRAWAQYDEFEDEDFVVEESMPILYFGDRAAYERSSLKVVTVGHNPSAHEFPDEVERFNGVESTPEPAVGEYLQALDNYFSGGTDYGEWFGNYEQVLRGLGASYYSGQNGTSSSNIALHTDLHSPLATTPQWSKLEGSFSGARERLAESGIELWRNLIEALKPDLILASLPKADVRKILNWYQAPEGSNGQSEEICRITEKESGEERADEYVVEGWHRSIAGKHALLVYGQKLYHPFGRIGHDQKEKVGREIREHLNLP